MPLRGVGVQIPPPTLATQYGDKPPPPPARQAPLPSSLEPRLLPARSRDASLHFIPHDVTSSLSGLPASWAICSRDVPVRANQSKRRSIVTAPSSTNGIGTEAALMARRLRRRERCDRLILLWTTPFGWVFVVTRAIELVVGLLGSLACGTGSRSRQALGIRWLLILAALLIRSASIDIDNGQWGAATVGLIGAVAGVSVAALGIVKTYVKRRDGQD